jgi:hypothetical protein
LINVYENQDIWKVKNRYFDNETDNDEDDEDDEDGMYVMPLPEEEILDQDDPAICLGGIETFQKNWNLFTECMLRKKNLISVFAKLI